jgi:hypothetical protein
MCIDSASQAMTKEIYLKEVGMRLDRTHHVQHLDLVLH